MPTTAFVLDNDQTRRDDIRIRLSHCGVLPICFQDEWICLENIHHIKPAFAIFRPDSLKAAIRFVTIAKAIQRTFPVIVLSNQPEIETVVHNNWLLNLFFLRYPAHEQDLQDAIALLAEPNQHLERPVLVAGCAESLKRIAMLPRFGLSAEPVLIQGEFGVGKRMITAAIQSCSMAEKPQIETVHASDISGQWVRATRERLDAQESSAGRIRFCVIENIDTLSIDLQSQLLLIMESPAVSAHVDGRGQAIRFFSLAEADLAHLSQIGRFRDDLYHRLSVLTMTVPPLRDRKEEVPALADFFAAKYGIRRRGTIFRLPKETREAFKNYDWPGNVAELKGTIQQMLATEALSRPEDMRGWCEHRFNGPRPQINEASIEVGDDVRQFARKHAELPLKKAKQIYAMQVERRFMKAALSKTNGNCKKAAGMLNISYKSMLNKVKEYSLVLLVGLLNWFY